MVLKEDMKLDEILENKIENQIREHTSPHHVPAKIIQAPDLPRTINGKLAEIAVKRILNQQEITNTEYSIQTGGHAYHTANCLKSYLTRLKV